MIIVCYILSYVKLEGLPVRRHGSRGAAAGRTILAGVPLQSRPVCGRADDASSGCTLMSCSSVDCLLPVEWACSTHGLGDRSLNCVVMQGLSRKASKQVPHGLCVIYSRDLCT